MVAACGRDSGDLARTRTESTSNPSGTVAKTDSALAAAERELSRRKADVSDADDLVSEALRNISEEDKQEAIRKLKEAIKKYSN